jgi:hypothetical protein
VLTSESTALLPVDLYQTELHLIWGEDLEYRVPRYRESLGLKPRRFPRGAVGVCFKVEQTAEGAWACVVALGGWDSSSTAIGILVHELFHAVEAIMEFIGAKHCEKSSENWAYLLQDLTERALDDML